MFCVLFSSYHLCNIQIIKNILEIIFFRFNLNWEKFTEVNTQILRKGDPEKVTSNPKKIKLDLNWSVKKPFEETIFEIIFTITNNLILFKPLYIDKKHV